MTLEKEFTLTDWEVESEIQMAIYDFLDKWFSWKDNLKQYIEDNTKVFTQDESFDEIFKKVTKEYPTLLY